MRARINYMRRKFSSNLNCTPKGTKKDRFIKTKSEVQFPFRSSLQVKEMASSHLVTVIGES